jgi:hypothetical protein
MSEHSLHRATQLGSKAKQQREKEFYVSDTGTPSSKSAEHTLFCIVKCDINLAWRLFQSPLEE